MDRVIKNAITVRGVIYNIVDGKYKFEILRAKKNYWQSPQGKIELEKNELETVY